MSANDGNPEAGAGIRCVDSLLDHLQTAVELEHSTIPPYLCALYSIKDGANLEAAEVIRSVVMEEMLHMTLVSNVMNAIGRSPAIGHKEFTPEYPGALPHSAATFEVGLLKLSPQALETFLRIERPESRDAPPEPDRYHTIGQFYDAIEAAMKRLEREAERKGKTIFTGLPDKQVEPRHYYYGGGEVIRVTDLNSALKALEEVKDQGEGMPGSIFDGDEQFGQPSELAHYFRFNEVYVGRFYQPSDRPSQAPSGKAFPIDWAAVWNMAPNPKAARYIGQPEIYDRMVAFNRQYTSFLRLLHDAFCGQPDLLLEAVPRMYELRYAATALMRTPAGVEGMTVGPSFEYWPD